MKWIGWNAERTAMKSLWDKSSGCSRKVDRKWLLSCFVYDRKTKTCNSYLSHTWIWSFHSLETAWTILCNSELIFEAKKKTSTNPPFPKDFASPRPIDLNSTFCLSTNFQRQAMNGVHTDDISAWPWASLPHRHLFPWASHQLRPFLILSARQNSRRTAKHGEHLLQPRRDQEIIVQAITSALLSPWQYYIRWHVAPRRQRMTRQMYDTSLPRGQETDDNFKEINSNFLLNP